MMADKRVVYVSSTFIDLEAHRAALKLELERAGFDVEAMERYPAFDERPLQRCLADVRRCDAYVLVVAHRYGHVPRAEDGRSLSITQREYEAAGAAGRPCFVFCVDLAHDWPGTLKDRPRSRSARRLKEFRRELVERHGHRTFTDPDNLTKQVLSALLAHGTAPRSGFAWPVPWDFGVFMAERRESFSGREWLIDEIVAWQSTGQPRALLLVAGFGVGKSALLAELVGRNPGGAIAAFHFCQHDTQATLDPGVFVQSVAAQLAAALPAYRVRIEADATLQQRLALASTDAGSALEGAVLAPLAGLPAPAAPRLLLVDALDEALELDAEAARRSGTIVALLTARARRFPPWLLVLATTRRNPQVLAPLQHSFGSREIDAESEVNQTDLQRHVLERAQREPLLGRLRAAGRTPRQLAELLLAHSQGRFLYAVRALADLEAGRLGVDALAALPPGLDGFYLDAFARRFGPGRADYAQARGLLGVLATAHDPLPTASLAEVPGGTATEVQAVQRVLPDFLRLRGGRLAFDHFSLAEWLTRLDDEGLPRAGDFAVDPVLAQRRLRDWALARVADGRAPASDYLLRHLGAHLRDAGERRQIYADLLRGSMDWLQARLAQGGVEALLSDADQLAGHAEQGLLQTLLRHSEAVLRAWPEQLPVQLAGRLGAGLGSARLLAPLAEAARAWVERAPADGPAAAAHEGWLLPLGRSLYLAVASLKVRPGGGAELALLPDGRVAFDTHAGDLCVWDLQGRQTPQTFEGHAGRVRALAVTNDGRLISCGVDGMVRSIDPATGGAARVFAGHAGPVRALAVLPGGRLASAGEDGSIHLQGPAPEDPRQVLRGHEGAVRVLAALPDGRLVSGGNDGSLRLWDPACEGAVATLALGAGPVRKLVVWPDGRVAAGTTGGMLHLWHPAAGTAPLSRDARACGAVRALLALPGGTLLSGHDDGSVLRWPVGVDAPQRIGRQMGFVRALARLPDGRLVSGATDGGVRVWDPGGPVQELPLAGHSGWIDALLPLPDGRFVSCANDGTLRLWDPRVALELQDPPGPAACVRALAASADGQVVAVGDDARVFRWETAYPDRPESWPAGPQALRAVHLRADGGVQVLDESGRLVQWDMACRPDVQTLPGLADGPYVLAGWPDGSLAIGDAAGQLLWWDPLSGAAPRLVAAHGHAVRALALLPDGRLASATRDGQLRLWPRHGAATPLAEARLGPLRSLAALPDGSLVVGGSDGSVRVFESGAGAPPQVFALHSGWVGALAVRPDGCIASGASDGTVCLWHPARPRRRWRFVADAGISALAAAGEIVAAGCEDGTVHLLRAAPASAATHSLMSTP